MKYFWIRYEANHDVQVVKPTRHGPIKMQVDKKFTLNTVVATTGPIVTDKELFDNLKKLDTKDTKLKAVQLHNWKELTKEQYEFWSDTEVTEGD